MDLIGLFWRRLLTSADSPNGLVCDGESDSRIRVFGTHINRFELRCNDGFDDSLLPLFKGLTYA